LETESLRFLTFSKKTVRLQDISNDGNKIIFSTSENTITQRPFSTSSFFQYDLTNNKVDSIWLDVPFIGNLKYSPDNKQILVFAAAAAFNKLGENIGKHKISNDYDGQAFIYNLNTKETKAITKNFDPAISSGEWNKADNCIYFKVTERDYERIYRYDPATDKFEMLALAPDLVQQFDINGNGLFAGVRGMYASYPTQSFVYNLQTKESKLISDPEKEKMSEIALGDVIDYNFEAKKGDLIYGRYYLPSDFDKTKKYPLIVYYYGGTMPTQRTFTANWNHHFWASMGYVVYVLQPSGTIGFGQEFSARHVNAWGDRTADDIIKGVKSFTKSHDFVDAEKIGCLGASYGGFMTMYLQTKTDIFATAISHAGISALSSYWGNGNWGYGYSGVATADTYPWNNPEFYTEHSPLFYADKINTPLLLIQGENDTNVPPGESMQMFTAMKILGKEVAMVRVKNEDHVIANYKHKIEWNYSLMAWMSKYLQNNKAWWENMYPDSKIKE
jgi:dipeptidyl aminopeptidase/acylaminoacyl peptidase